MLDKLLKHLKTGDLDTFPTHLEEYLGTEGNAIDDVDHNGNTALIFASARGYHEATFDLLISRGAQVNKPNNTGGTALMYAAYYGEIDVMERLLKEGASIDQKDLAGDTALEHSCYGVQYKATTFLFKKGAKIANINCFRDDPHGMVAYLIECGIKVSYVVEHFLLYNCFFCIFNEAEAEPIDYLIYQLGTGDLSTFSAHLKSYLAEESHTVDDANQQGMTLLMFASYKNHAATIRLLITEGADPNRCNNEEMRMTPLMIAACFGRVRAMRCLLKAGAHKNLDTNECATALGYALAGDHIKAITLLIKQHASPGKVHPVGAGVKKSGTHLIVFGMNLPDVYFFVSDNMWNSDEEIFLECLQDAERILSNEEISFLQEQHCFKNDSHNETLKTQATQTGAALAVLTPLLPECINIVNNYLYRNPVLIECSGVAAQDRDKARAIIYSDIYKPKQSQDTRPDNDENRRKPCCRVQ